MTSRLASPTRFLLAACVLAGLPWLAGGQTPTQREYELKAGILYQILKYVEWPADSADSGSRTPPVIQIGLLGQIPFVEALEVLDGKTNQSRRVVVKRISEAQAPECQVVFIGASEKGRIREIAADLGRRPILTVSEVDGFAQQGGMVSLVMAQNRILMEINREVASQARLGVSSQLLKVAARVYPK